MVALWLQLSAGRGPVECARAVLLLADTMREDADSAGIELNCLDVRTGPEPKTALSCLFSARGVRKGDVVEAWARSWAGTVQWIAPSPFRPRHKRKNWFVNVSLLRVPEDRAVNLSIKDVRFETCKSSGPGGQHVNTTNSAVRAIHRPSGLIAQASEERSQHRNKSLALARLQASLDSLANSDQLKAENDRWQQHDQLERGRPVRVFKGVAFLPA